MSEERTKLEVIAPSVEEAIEKGLNELGLTKDDVDVEILDEGKKGLLGLGIRQARIALKIKSPQEKPTESPLVEKPKAISEETKKNLPFSEEPEEVGIARETINIILEKMRVNADVYVKLGDRDNNGVQPVLIDIEGNDLSFLIGRKAETINALQYITSLVVGRELGRWVPLQIDVQNYRKRREDELRKLARRIADQVESTGRKQVLEPLPPNERRIIHIELKDNPNVETKSVGEDPKRKVTVLPKV
ncbi:MAG: RNA-binding cell elongation regulator Jag/EloR [Chloroflexota bacterium]|jgi:spoIIIJ-associated protein|nr:RNA-binding cell elongation regulator Jag/EloR [Chloroflexota bacterium]